MTAGSASSRVYPEACTGSEGNTEPEHDRVQSLHIAGSEGHIADGRIFLHEARYTYGIAELGSEFYAERVNGQSNPDVTGHGHVFQCIVVLTVARGWKGKHWTCQDVRANDRSRRQIESQIEWDVNHGYVKRIGYAGEGHIHIPDIPVEQTDSQSGGSETQVIDDADMVSARIVERGPTIRTLDIIDRFKVEARGNTQLGLGGGRS